MLDYKKIGTFINELRVNKGYSQEELANLLFISRQQISKWERGLALPNYETLIQFCNLFKISLNEFFSCKKNKISWSALTSIIVLSLIIIVLIIIILILLIKD